MSVIFDGSRILLSRVRIGGALRQLPDWSQPVVPIQVSPGIGQNEQPGRRHGYSLSMSADANTLFVGNLNSLDDDIEGVMWMQTDPWVSQSLVVTDQTSAPGTGYTKGLLNASGTLFVGGNISNGLTARIDSYTRSGNVWSRTQLLTIPGGSYTDFSMDSTGETLVAASRVSSTKTIHTFVRSGDSWVESGTMNFPAQNSVRLALSADGQTLVASDLDATIGGVQFVGRVFVYTRNGNSWVQQTLLQPSTPVNATRFGDVIHLSPDGNRLFVRGPVASATSQSHHLKQYLRSGSEWQALGDFTISDVTDADQLGRAVAFNSAGNIMAISTPAKDSNKGRVFVFSLRNNAWTLEQEFFTPVITNSGFGAFGTAVCLSADGKKMLVSAPYSGDGTNTYLGTVHLYNV